MRTNENQGRSDQSLNDSYRIAGYCFGALLLLSILFYLFGGQLIW